MLDLIGIRRGLHRIPELAFEEQQASEMLSGIRKFGVTLTLCHQYLRQLDDDLAEAMIGTMGATLAFQLGGNDAERLAKTFNIKPEELRVESSVQIEIG